MPALPYCWPGYIAQAQYYNQAFGDFFQRLAGDGITRASTNAVESTSAGDATYHKVNASLLGLEKVRDALTNKVKIELNAAAFDNTAIPDAHGQLVLCQSTIGAAKVLAAVS